MALTEPDEDRGPWRRIRPYLAGAIVGGALVGALAWADGVFDSEDPPAGSGRAEERPEPRPEPEPPEPEPVVIAAAGDIACPGTCGQDETADLVEEIDPDAVLGVGDFQYERGTAEALARHYEPYWGRFKEKTYPALGGSHDFDWKQSELLDYWNDGGPVELKPEQSYSFELGEWQILALNTNCLEQETCDHEGWGKWIAKELRESDAPCTLAFFHHSYFTSSSDVHDPDEEIRPWIEILHEGGADVVLQAHQHFYERLAPQDPDRARDDARGIRPFVVGTGGRSHYELTDVAPHSEARDDQTFGVLKMTLRASDYDWEFVPEPGKSFTDSGTSTCH